MKKLVFVISLIFISLLLFLGFKRISHERFTMELVGHKSNLEQVINNTLKDSTGLYAIAIKNLKNGEEYYRDKDRMFSAGSLYKLGVMLTAIQQLEKGEMSEDEVLIGNVKDINKILGVASDEAELKDGTVDFTIFSALRQMISISHNYAAVLLTQKVGTDKIQQVIEKLELKNTLINVEGRPKTTAGDLLTFFEKIYQRDGVNAYASHQIIELLLAQDINDRIPKYLPKEAKVAHKTGEIDFAKHDAGIVFTPNGDYIIVVLSETDSPAAASERIANISREVYEYFNKRN